MLSNRNLTSLPCDLYKNIFSLIHNDLDSPSDIQNIRMLSKFFKFQTEKYLSKTSTKIEIVCEEENTDIPPIVFYLHKRDKGDGRKFKINPQIMHQMDENISKFYLRLENKKHGISIKSEPNAKKKYSQRRGNVLTKVSWVWKFPSVNNSRWLEIRLSHKKDQSSSQESSLSVLMLERLPSGTYGVYMTLEIMLDLLSNSN